MSPPSQPSSLRRKGFRKGLLDGRGLEPATYPDIVYRDDTGVRVSLPESLHSTLMFAQINLDTTQHKAASTIKRPLTPTLSLGGKGEIPGLQAG